MTACNRPVVDPRDDLLPDIAEDGLPDRVTWQTASRPRYPRTHYAEGAAVLSCVLQSNGGLDQCVVESEFRPKAASAEHPWTPPVVPG